MKEGNMCSQADRQEQLPNIKIIWNSPNYPARDDTAQWTCSY